MTVAAHPPARRKGGIFSELYVQVLIALVVGAAIGVWFPRTGVKLEPLGSGFIRLIRMLLAPIIGGTVAVGVAKMGSVRDAGRVGLKALLYFEVVSSGALLFGLLAAHLIRPGAGMNLDAAAIDASALAPYTTAAAHPAGVSGYLLAIIPDSMVGAFARGDMLPVLLVSLLLGVAIARHPVATKPLLDVIEAALAACFGVVAIVMRLAPLGALGAVAYTVARYGIASLAPLAKLVAAVYGSCFVFIILVLGAVTSAAGMNLFKLLRFLREEILIVFGTSSSETVLPRMLLKMERLGCAKPVVNLVIPAGYAFNPDGTAIYLTMAALFLAQATNTRLTLGDEATVLGVLLLASKGSAGVTGAGFITLAATLAAVGKIPLAGLTVLLGVERVINAARAVTNLIGNAVATVVIARWEGGFNAAEAAAAFEADAAKPR